MNVKYVLVETKSYAKKLEHLQHLVLSVMFVSLVLVALIAFVLSRFFLKPLHNRMVQIENFIQDISHELNTPITAQKMSASRAIKKEHYDKKILINISISTKQFESIYKSLTFLNFKQEQEEPSTINFKTVVTNVVLSCLSQVSSQILSNTVKYSSLEVLGLD